MSEDFAIEVRGVKLSFPLVRFRSRGVKEAFLNMVRRAPKLEHERKFWALQGIDLTVRRGEVLGLVGRNGSGKSTLLRVMCGIYTPDEGTVIARGRISSLLELGAGFRDELTGYENIRLSGAILGLTKSQIDHLTPDIVEFAGLGEFMDQPLKTYSSGMKARLGFAVATAVDPDILLIDEALAVGDAAFREKSMAKVTEMVANEETTVVIVSHNAQELRRLSTRMVLLNGGKVVTEGAVEEVMSAYEKSLKVSSAARG